LSDELQKSWQCIAPRRRVRFTVWQGVGESALGRSQGRLWHSRCLPPPKPQLTPSKYPVTCRNAPRQPRIHTPQQAMLGASVLPETGARCPRRVERRERRCSPNSPGVHAQGVTHRSRTAESCGRQQGYFGKPLRLDTAHIAALVGPFASRSVPRQSRNRQTAPGM
jgi:hypothetical protein